MSTKMKQCPACAGRGRVMVLHNGTVIDSRPCLECKGTGKVPRKKVE